MSISRNYRWIIKLITKATFPFSYTLNIIQLKFILKSRGYIGWGMTDNSDLEADNFTYRDEPISDVDEDFEYSET